MNDEAPVPPHGGAVPGDFPRAASRFRSQEVYYTDEELLKAQRSQLVELEQRADELEAQVLAAQGRLGTLAMGARTRSEEIERQQVADLVPWAKQESVAIVRDARQRAAELSVGNDVPADVEELGRLLLSHFELQEQLVRLLAEMAPAPGSRGPS